MTIIAPPLTEHIDHFQRRVLQDALADATAVFWERRAEVFEAARPRAGDYHGRATRDDLAAADKRCSDTAEACRQRARWALIRERGAA